MKNETITDTDAPEWPDPADKAHAVEPSRPACFITGRRVGRGLDAGRTAGRFG